MIHRALLAFALFSFSGAAASGDGPTPLSVTAVDPPPGALAAPRGGAITVTFDRPVDPSSVVARRSFWAFGRWTGTLSGTFSFSDGDRTVSLVPDRPLTAGDRVMVILSHDLRGMDGAFLRGEGFSYQFWTAARSADLDFGEVDRFSTRTTAAQSSRAYGGIASDLDGNGFPDITIVNEDTADLRVFLNGGDGAGTFEDMLQPTVPVGNQASPSEPSDFDRDGEVDVCVANIADGTVSVVLGNGDGTFQPQQTLAVGSNPRGIAVLDADGDGDTDIAVTSSDASTITLLLNDGSGAFGSPSTFGTGSAGEWALAAVDLDEDGILDLVAGGRGSERLYVYTGDGDGTFSAAGDQDAGGGVWMLATGDVNGDGHEDVTGVNSFANNGAILLGDGTGALGAPQTYATDPFPLAVDLGDLDGDGDLDWVTSSFSGDWFLFTNDGSGAFTFDQDFAAPRAASCALMVDVDGDDDLDLALIDELEDEVIVLTHGAPALFADGFESGDTSAWSAVSDSGE